MTIIDKDTLRGEMNRLGEARVPFLWGISYDFASAFVEACPEGQGDLLWHVGRYGNDLGLPAPLRTPLLEVKSPLARAAYSGMFATVRRGLLRGDSFLANLTGATEVECSGSMRDVFLSSSAPFRLMLGDSFVCFSPEPFVRISGGRISAFPMKGTADATVEGAEQALLDDYKEMCEHYTIVDLMRNDLNSVATDVHVERFRYVERIATSSGAILQTSSEITGRLAPEMAYRFGDVILPIFRRKHHGRAQGGYGGAYKACRAGGAGMVHGRLRVFRRRGDADGGHDPLPAARG